MFEQIKLSLRITHDSLDNDIQRNIDAALLDLKRVGVNVSPNNGVYDGLIVKAIELYVKAAYDFDGKGEQFRKNYESLSRTLSKSGGYNNAE